MASGIAGPLAVTARQSSDALRVADYGGKRFVEDGSSPATLGPPPVTLSRLGALF
jgi:hypothetical protein